MDKIEIKEDCKVIDARNAMLNGSYFNDVAMTGVRIINANLSDLEIEGAQLGGAFIHNIGGAPEGHPVYDPNFEQRPLRFEDCDLHGSTITNCNLSGIQITDCNISGLTIDGVNIEELLKECRN
jgi:uncharacterized protein YjbI with pentapeptide repeats